MKITLTFDNGPDPEITPEVLRILDRHDIRACFFQVGEKIAQHGLGFARSMISAGHRVGNHSYSHSVPIGLLDDEAAVREIAETQDLLKPLALEEKLFRPFGGEGRIGPHLFNRGSWEYLAAQGFTCILWNVLAREWERPGGWAKPTLDDVVQRDWSVVVIHDIFADVPNQLAYFLDELIVRGAEFRQDFPDSCVAMQRGIANREIASDIIGVDHTLESVCYGHV